VVSTFVISAVTDFAPRASHMVELAILYVANAKATLGIEVVSLSLVFHLCAIIVFLHDVLIVIF
jgi:hypothetical protein